MNIRKLLSFVTRTLQGFRMRPFQRFSTRASKGILLLLPKDGGGDLRFGIVAVDGSGKEEIRRSVEGNPVGWDLKLKVFCEQKKSRTREGP